MRPHEDFHPGERVSARRLNELKDDLDAAGAKIFPAGMDRAGTIDPPAELRPIARITGRQTPDGTLQTFYNYQVIGWGNITLGYLPRFLDIPGFAEGPSLTPAFERSNNAAVPVDGTALVELIDGPDGSVMFDWTDTVVYALLGTEGTTGFYAWLEQYPTAGGGMANVPNGRSGTNTVNFAHELNGGTGLAGKHVTLTRGFCSGAAAAVVTPLTTADGSSVHEQQTLTIVHAVGGTFTLSFNSFDPTNPASTPNLQTTAPIAYNANAAAIQSALVALSNITSVTVTGTNPFTISFTDTFIPYPMMLPDSFLLKNDQEWLFSLATGAGTPKATFNVTVYTKTLPNAYGHTTTYVTNDTLTSTTNVNIGLIDNITVTNGDTVLIDDGTTDSGWYTIVDVGDGSHPWQLVRKTDSDNTVPSGSVTTIKKGDVYTGLLIPLLNDDPVNVGVVPLVFGDPLRTGLPGNDIDSIFASGMIYTGTTTGDCSFNSVGCDRQIRTLPMMVSKRMTITGLRVWFTASTGASGTKLRLALYDSAGSGNPRPRNMLAATADVACDSGVSGNQFIGGSITAQTLVPGIMYHIAINCDGPAPDHGSGVSFAGIVSTALICRLGCDLSTGQPITCYEDINPDTTALGTWPTNPGAASISNVVQLGVLVP